MSKRKVEKLQGELQAARDKIAELEAVVQEAKRQKILADTVESRLDAALERWAAKLERLCKPGNSPTAQYVLRIWPPAFDVRPANLPAQVARFEMKRPWTVQQYIDGRKFAFSALSFCSDNLAELEPDGDSDCKLIVGCGIRYYVCAQSKVFDPAKRSAWTQPWIDMLKQPFTEVDGLWDKNVKVNLEQASNLDKLAGSRLVSDARSALDVSKLNALDRAASAALDAAAKERERIRAGLRETRPWSRGSFNKELLDKFF